VTLQERGRLQLWTTSLQVWLLL